MSVCMAVGGEGEDTVELDAYISWRATEWIRMGYVPVIRRGSNGTGVGCVWAVKWIRCGYRWIIVEKCGSVKGAGHGSCRKKGVGVRED